jgi:hypothetical protein
VKTTTITTIVPILRNRHANTLHQMQICMVIHFVDHSSAYLFFLSEAIAHGSLIFLQCLILDSIQNSLHFFHFLHAQRTLSIKVHFTQIDPKQISETQYPFKL